MEDQQAKLLELRAPQPSDDYLGLFPERVMPSMLSVLEQNGDLLFLRRLATGTKVTPKQDAIFRQLVEMGKTDSITVMCIWGLRGQRGRAIRIYAADDIREIPATDDIVRAEIESWWNDRTSD